MESIKNKMEALVKEKEASTKAAEDFESDKAQLDAKAADYDKQINEINRKIAHLEDELDTTITATAVANENLEVAAKTANDAELEVSALVRRVQLLEEENNKVNERLEEVVTKLTTVEKDGEDNERQRKAYEAKSFQNEETIELNEAQVEEAKIIAEESDRKYDEIQRKLKIVENDYERITDRIDESEGKIKEYEEKLENDRQKLNELEKLAGQNTDKEDQLEDEVKRLSEALKNGETRAEFSERTVEKLESNIDNLQDGLFQEKSNFISLSKKLDETLNDMMSVQ